MGIGDRALAFAKGMLVHGDGVRAARDAGYKGGKPALQQRADALMKHPDVQDILAAVSRKEVLVEAARAEALKGVKDELETREGRIRWLCAMARGEILEPRSYSVGDGMTEFEDLKPSAAARMAAVKMLGQMHGDFVEHLHVTNEQQHTVFVMPSNSRGPLPPEATIVVDTLPADLKDAVAGSDDKRDTELDYGIDPE